MDHHHVVDKCPIIGYACIFFRFTLSVARKKNAIDNIKPSVITLITFPYPLYRYNPLDVYEYTRDDNRERSDKISLIS